MKTCLASPQGTIRAHRVVCLPHPPAEALSWIWVNMARGWESKEVESQQAQAEESMRARKSRITTEQLERNARVQPSNWMLRALSAKRPRPLVRRIAQLQAALDYVHEKLRQVD